MKEVMSSYERVLAALAGQLTDRPALVSPTSIVCKEAMMEKDLYFNDIYSCPEKRAELAAHSAERAGFDTIQPYFSIHMEASALGAPMRYGSKFRIPAVACNIVKNTDDYESPDDFLDRVPVQGIIASIKLLKQRYGQKKAVIGKVIGPWSLAYQLYGVPQVSRDIVLNPEKLQSFINALSQLSLKMAFAQIEAGADALTWADHATPDTVSREVYREFLLPIHQLAAQKITSYCPVILHTCGNVEDRIDLFAKSGFTAFHIESRNNLVHCQKKVSDQMLLVGGVNNPQTLSSGSVEDVAKEVEELMHLGFSMIGPECGIPTGIPLENLQVISKTVKGER